MLKPSELLSQPDSWCQESWAKDSRGLSCGPSEKHAVRWCALGAIERTSIDAQHGNEMRRKLQTHLYGDWSNITSWNDDPARTQDDVVRAFKEIGL